MLGPLKINLAEFGVSPRQWLSNCLLRLPNTYYESWERIVHQLPSLLKAKRLRQEVDNLELLSTSWLGPEREWQRAYVLLSFMAHAYMWGGERPSEVCTS